MSEGRRTKFYLIIGFGGLLCALVATAIVLNYAQLGVAKKRANDRENAKIAVLVAVDPLAYFVERIGGDRVSVATLTPAGKDPESFSPTPAELARVAATRLFFRVGLPVEERFEKNVSSVAPNSKTVDLREGLEPELKSESAPDLAASSESTPESDADARDAKNAEAPSISETPSHSHSKELDPHLWTSPKFARSIAARIAARLGEESPENADFFAKNAAELDAELAALETEIANRLAPFAGRTFVVFHPAYGYFARDFQLNQRAIESEGKAPRPRELAELIELVKNEKIRALIVQPEFNRSSAESVANSIGVDLIVHSPLEKDYFANLRSLTDAVAAALATNVR